MTPLLLLIARADPGPILNTIADDHSGVVMITQGAATGDVVVQHVVGHGRTAPGNPNPPDPDTLLWAGSLSKQFTAAAALALVDAGTISLDQTVTSIFPELPAASLSLEGEDCTVARLLRATCGLPRQLGSPSAFAGIATEPKVQEDFLDTLATTPLLFAPGSDHLYSNVGYDLAGLLVERAAQAPVAAVLAPLLQRAGMTSTGTDPDALDGFDDRIAWGQFTVLGPAWSGRWLRLGPRKPTTIGAAGNVFSTAADMARWTAALHGGELLSADSLAAMTTPEHDDYAMGLVVDGEAGARFIWHNGALIPHGYSTAVGWHEATDTTIVVLNNQTTTPDATDLMFELERMLRGKAFEAERLETTLQERVMAGLMGANYALLGPLMLLGGLFMTTQTPKTGRLVWLSGVVSIYCGGVFALTMLAPLLPSVLGLLVLAMAAAMVIGLRRHADRPLIYPEKKKKEALSGLIYLATIGFFSLAPISSTQTTWTAVVLGLVAGVELWRAR